MDNSVVYIGMCEKAKEIQSDAHFIYDVWFGNIWLPRQDQLQAMVSEHFKAGLDLCNFYAWYMQNRPSDVAKEVDSMEQLWLAFVMHKKFGGKTWNGETWVK